MDARTLVILGSMGLVATSCGGGKATTHGTGAAGTSTSGGGGATSASNTTGMSSSTGSPTSTTTTTATSSAGGTGGASSCLASALLAGLGKTHVLVGASMQDATAKAAPFDGRYQYLSGGIFDSPTPCASCATGCTAAMKSCTGGGCGWWGCWQSDTQPPGQFVVGFDGTAASNSEIPMFTYYEVLQTTGVKEGGAEVTAMNDQAFLTRYLADFTFVAKNIGMAKALVHIEPDFWGYAEQMNADPHAEPAKVKEAAPSDCSSQEDSIAGLGRCMISIVHKYAPNARVGLHASGWGTNMDVLGNTSPSFNVAGEAQKLGNWLVAAGAAEGDFVVADMSDRDAGYYMSIGKNTWWDATNATLPNFHQAFAWAKAVAETVGKPVVWWQIPVGNMAQNNTMNHWQDNRVDYLLGHMSEVAASHGAGLFFGAGDGAQTTPESDGGNLIAKVKAYAAAGSQTGCP
jgi:hypothetical protein